MAESLERQSAAGTVDLEKVMKIKLKVTDRETGEVRYCTMDEAKAWDWGNQEIWRIVSGWQITSFKGLVSMVRLKAEKGQTEVEVLESPRCLLLAGG